LKELYNKNNNSHIKQEAIVLIDELVKNATYMNSLPSTESHGWVDNYGKNKWDYWKVYIQEKNKTVWEATLIIANTSNGEKILYDIGPIKMVEGPVKSGPTTTKTKVQQNGPNVNTPNSSVLFPMSCDILLSKTLSVGDKPELSLTPPAVSAMSFLFVVVSSTINKR